MLLILKCILVIVFFNTSMSSASSADFENKTTYQNVSVYIKKSLPHFQVYESKNFDKRITSKFLLEEPMKAFGDFNLDQHNDVVLYGYNKKKNLSVIYMFIVDKNNPRNFNHYIVDAEPLKSNHHIQKKTYIQSHRSQLNKKLSIDALQVDSYENGFDSASFIYYFSNKENDVVPFINNFN